MRVRVLGSGSSAGTPSIAGGWGAADPNEPRNRRLRPSILVEEGETRVLVDASPDLRQQLLAAEVDRLDAIIFTHAHADHCHGIDDLRPVNEAMNADLAAYADAGTWETIGRRFDYVLEPRNPKATFHYKPTLVPHTITPGQPFQAGGLSVLPLDQDHGFMRTVGLRFGRFAYSTDLVELPDASLTALAGVEVWMIGTLGTREHPTHAHVDKAVGWIERVGPKRAYLTHMSNRIDYQSLKRSLPPHIEPAYDGLVIDT